MTMKARRRAVSTDLRFAVGCPDHDVIPAPIEALAEHTPGRFNPGGCVPAITFSLFPFLCLILAATCPGFDLFAPWSVPLRHPLVCDEQRDYPYWRIGLDV